MRICIAVKAVRPGLAIHTDTGSVAALVAEALVAAAMAGECDVLLQRRFARRTEVWRVAGGKSVRVDCLDEAKSKICVR